MKNDATTLSIMKFRIKTLSIKAKTKTYPSGAPLIKPLASTASFDWAR